MNEHLKHKNLISRWLDNRITREEEERLRTTKELDKLKVVLDDIGTWKTPAFDVEKGLEELDKKKRLTVTKSKKPVRRYLISIAATVLILIGTYFTREYYFSNSIVEYTTTIGETKDIRLPRGSSVKLDVLSKVSYKEKYWSKSRTLTLEGQAYFEVTNGAPFVVLTNTGSITVLGTQFNVKSDGKSFLVKCFEGDVLVEVNNQKKIISTGEVLVLEEGKLIKSQHIDTTEDWVLGLSKYNQATLKEVIENLEKYYAIKVQLPKKYEQLKFTGIIVHNDLQNALRTLFIPMELKYSSKNDGRIVVE